MFFKKILHEGKEGPALTPHFLTCCFYMPCLPYRDMAISSPETGRRHVQDFDNGDDNGEIVGRSRGTEK